MTTVGLVLAVLGLLLLLVSTIGASTDRSRADGFAALKWLWGEIKKLIPNLTAAGIKWYRRTVALGEICLLVGLFLVVLGAVGVGDSGGGGPNPTTTVATTSSGG